MQETSLSTSTSYSVKDYTNPEIEERRWCVEYVGGRKFYLTDSERKEFLIEIGRGKTHVQVGPITLTARFSYIFPIRDFEKHRHAFVEVNGKLTCECGLSQE